MTKMFKRHMGIVREVVAERVGVPPQSLHLTGNQSHEVLNAARIAAYSAFQALPVTVYQLAGLFSADLTRMRLALLRVRERSERDGAFAAELAEVQAVVTQRLAHLQPPA